MNERMDGRMRSPAIRWTHEWPDSWPRMAQTRPEITGLNSLSSYSLVSARWVRRVRLRAAPAPSTASSRRSFGQGRHAEVIVSSQQLLLERINCTHIINQWITDFRHKLTATWHSVSQSVSL